MSRLYDRYGFTIKEGEYLFKEGDKADSLFMIHAGTIKISRIVQNTEEILQTLTEGEFVGEMAVIDSMPRSADAVALVDSKLIRMDKFSFDEIIVQNSQFASSFISFLSKRIRTTNEMMKTIAEKRLEDKMYIELLKDFVKTGKRDPNRKLFLVNMQQFLDKYTKVHHGDYEKFWSTIDSLIGSGKLKVVQSKDGDKWLSLLL